MFDEKTSHHRTLSTNGFTCNYSILSQGAIDKRVGSP